MPAILFDSRVWPAPTCVFHIAPLFHSKRARHASPLRCLSSHSLQERARMRALPHRSTPTHFPIDMPSFILE